MYFHYLKKALPLPKLIDFERYLFVGAHPDDIEIGCGGTIAKLTHLGKTVKFVIVTDGGSGSTDPKANPIDLVQMRKAESDTSRLILKVSSISFLGFPDGGEYSIWDVAKKLAPIIYDWNPDIIVAPDPQMPSEIHPDHIRCGEAIKIAGLMAAYPLIYKQHVKTDEELDPNRFRMRSLAFYYTHRPNRFVRLNADEVSMQKEAISAHASQFPKPEDLSIILTYLKLRGRLFGSVGRRQIEGYFVLGKEHQHCFPEVNRY